MRSPEHDLARKLDASPANWNSQNLVKKKTPARYHRRSNGRRAGPEPVGRGGAMWIGRRPPGIRSISASGGGADDDDGRSASGGDDDDAPSAHWHSAPSH